LYLKNTMFYLVMKMKIEWKEENKWSNEKTLTAFLSVDAISNWIRHSTKRCWCLEEKRCLHAAAWRHLAVTFHD
jgi:hypothetical protein